MSDRLSQRLDNLRRFADGTHPLIRAAFYNGSPQSSSLSGTEVPVAPRSPFRPFPAILSDRQLAGDQTTDEFVKYGLQTGEGIIIQDGYNVTLHTEIGPIIVMIDTASDPFLKSAIAQMETKSFQNTSLQRKLFNIGWLLFGNWQQERKPLTSFHTDRKDPLRIYLGELVISTDFRDLDCIMLALANQAVGQAVDIDILFHLGSAALFSSHSSKSDSHSWNTVRDGENILAVDWSILPPDELFAFFNSIDPILMKYGDPEKRKRERDRIYEEFIRKFYRFPNLFQEPRPPRPEQFDELVYGENLMPAARNAIVYWNDQGEYLGTARMPGGWEE